MRRIDGRSKLIQDLKRQKPKAQREAFDAYATYLYRICYRYLGQKENSEDVLSQVFLKIFENLTVTTIEEEGKLKAWMKRIAINQCLQEIRKKDVFAGSLELYEEVQESDLQTDQNLLKEDLVQMVMKLPVGYRAVFSLFAIEGYSHQEISEQLQITVGASKSQQSKARRLLKEQLMNMK